MTNGSISHKAASARQCQNCGMTKICATEIEENRDRITHDAQRLVARYLLHMTPGLPWSNRQDSPKIKS